MEILVSLGRLVRLLVAPPSPHPETVNINIASFLFFVVCSKLATPFADHGRHWEYTYLFSSRRCQPLHVL